MEKQKGSEGIGLNANVALNLGNFTAPLDMLTNALKETGEKAKSLISEAVSKLSEANVEKLQAASEKEGGHGPATDTYNRSLKELRAASDKGDTEAKKLLTKMKA